jgi:hypothetical protein
MKRTMMIKFLMSIYLSPFSIVCANRYKLNFTSFLKFNVLNDCVSDTRTGIVASMGKDGTASLTNTK